MSERPCILLVEDNPWDARVTREALEAAPLRAIVHVVSDGRSALAFLRRTGGPLDPPLPDLVLLDLNLPGIDGRTVLAEVKNDPQINAIPVVVLTSSRAQSDVTRAHDLHASAYLMKPTDPDDFGAVVAAVSEFWTARNLAGGT